MAFLYKTDGTRQEIFPKEEKFTLEELYQALDCELVQVVRLTPEMIMIIDEEGKYTKSDINAIATFIAHVVNAIHYNDFIVGDAIVCNHLLFE